MMSQSSQNCTDVCPPGLWDGFLRHCQTIEDCCYCPMVRWHGNCRSFCSKLNDTEKGSHPISDTDTTSDIGLIYLAIWPNIYGHIQKYFNIIIFISKAFAMILANAAVGFLFYIMYTFLSLCISSFIDLLLFLCDKCGIKCMTCLDDTTPKIDIIYNVQANSITPPHPLNTTKTSVGNQVEDCIICYDPPISKGRLAPCGHASFCFNCCIRLAKQPKARCPLCRASITQVRQENTPMNTISC